MVLLLAATGPLVMHAIAVRHIQAEAILVSADGVVSIPGAKGKLNNQSAAVLLGWGEL